MTARRGDIRDPREARYNVSNGQHAAGPVNMNAYRQRDELFPIRVGHFKRASACLHRDLMVEMAVVHVWLEHSD